MRLHPLSVPYRVLSRALKFGWAIVIAVAASSGEGFLAQFWPLVLAVALVVALGGLAYEYVYYRHFEYALADDTLDIDSGVFARRAREVPYRRIQNVDVTRTVVQRALGIATVRIETAGGGSTEATFECVGTDEAERLQTEIRRLKTAKVEREAGTETTTETGERSPAESGNLLYELDDRSLLAYSFLAFNPRFLSGLAVLFPFLGPVTAGLGLRRLRLDVATLLAVGLAGVGLLVLVAGVWLVSAAARFVQFYDFRLVREGDDLRYERGLLKRYTGTIPLEKVQSVSVRENLFMRRVGYATLAVETAGYAPGDTPAGGSEAAVPFATRDDVFALAQHIEPFEVPSVERPPKRARRRYAGRYSILAGVAVAGAFVADNLLGVPLWWLSLALLPVAVVAGHYRWVHLGHDEQATHAVTRSGFWSRSTTVVPHYRLQTVTESQSVFQRRWGLASVAYDTAGARQLLTGGAVVHDVDADTASGIVSRAVDGLRRTLGGDGSTATDEDRVDETRCDD